MARRRYRRPPIKEALVEFRFDTSEWTFSSPATLYEHLRADYPGEPVQHTASAIELSASGDASLRVQPQEPQVRYSTESGQRIVLIGRSALSVHVVEEYPGWEVFSRMVFDALDIYQKVVNPHRVVRVGVRYINRIRLDETIIELEEYFTVPPEPPPGLDLATANFFSRAEFFADGGERRLVQTFGSAESEPGSVAFILDLDAIWDGSQVGGASLTVRDARSKVEQLRTFERDCFEASITHRLREVFDEE